jgi:serine/threonine protein phosphatase PrpC
VTDTWDADLLAGDQIAGTRAYQEDDFRITGFEERDPDGCDLLLVLADGMGGHRGGAQASRLAVATFVDTFGQATGDIAARLRASLDAANAVVGQCAGEHAQYAGMGCTLVACVVTYDAAAHWISVGDSLLWRLRAGDDGRLERLNADHSMRPVLEELVRQGRMTEEEIQGGAAHQLRSAVMGEELTLVDEDAPPVRLGIGDGIVLASDGLETLSEEEIRRLCSGSRPSAVVVADLLGAVEAADRPSQDNTTVVVYRHVAAAVNENQAVVEALLAAGETRSFDGMEFVWVPAGEFRMGSKSSEAEDNEQPVTRVRISRGFWLGKHEVTQAEWEHAARAGTTGDRYGNMDGSWLYEAIDCRSSARSDVRPGYRAYDQGFRLLRTGP